MQCPRCRVENDANADYCRGCGMPVRRPSPSWAGAVSATAVAPPPKPARNDDGTFDPDIDQNLDAPEGVHYIDPADVDPRRPPPTTKHRPTPPPPVPYANTHGYPATPPVMGYAAQMNFQYAGVLTRFVASLIDGIVFFVVYALIMLAVTPVGGTADPAQMQSTMLMMAMLQLGLYLSNWVYFAMMESSSYQATLGKLMMGIRVTDLHGQPIGFGRASARYWGKLLSGIFMIGYLMAFFTERTQALHDLLAGCVVVRKSA